MHTTEARSHTHQHTNNSIHLKTEFSKSNYSTKMSAKRWIHCCCRYGSTQHRVCSYSFCWNAIYAIAQCAPWFTDMWKSHKYPTGIYLNRIGLMAIADKFRELQNYDVRFINRHNLIKMYFKSIEFMFTLKTAIYLLKYDSVYLGNAARLSIISMLTAVVVRTDMCTYRTAEIISLLRWL